jgi:hypothetical protein
VAPRQDKQGLEVAQVGLALAEVLEVAREYLNYDERRPTAGFDGLSVDNPIAGFYSLKLRTGGMRVGVRIWNGPPHDPVTGEELDRGWRWQAEINGRPADLERCWPKCGADKIEASEYEYLTELQRWGEENEPNGPQANPDKPIDFLRAPLPF